MRVVTDYSFGVILMFLWMGAFVSVSGISREPFRAPPTPLSATGRAASASRPSLLVAALPRSRSSVATAATFSAVALSVMPLRLSAILATGVIAVGGTLGAMPPPSTVLAVYGIITQQDIGCSSPDRADCS